jgi:hypothetical protein
MGVCEVLSSLQISDEQVWVPELKQQSFFEQGPLLLVQLPDNHLEALPLHLQVQKAPMLFPHNLD